MAIDRHREPEQQQQGENFNAYRARVAPWRKMRDARAAVISARDEARKSANDLAGLLVDGSIPASQRARVERWRDELAEAHGMLRELDTAGWMPEMRTEIAYKATP